MKVLVVGGCGFIGSHVVDALLRERHNVRVLSLAPERFRAPLAGVDYHFGDFRDIAVVRDALVGVDAVFHVASTTFPATADKDPQGDVRDNLLSTMSLVEAMLDVGVSRLLFMSSGGTVYGIPETVPIPEDHPLRPMGSYGIVKVAIEHFLGHYQRTRGLSPLLVRASNPVGPRQSAIGVQGVVATFLERIASDQPLEIWGDGSIIRDYIDVGDLADFCVLAGLSPRTGAYNAGSGVGTSIAQIADLVRDITGHAAPVVYKAGRPTDVPVSVLSSDRAWQDFAWRPQRSLRSSIESAWTWRRSEPSLNGR